MIRRDTISDQKKRELYDNFRDKGCMFCPEKHPSALDAHHVNKKKFNISSAVTGKIGFDLFLAELNKCICICSTCHRKLHWILKEYDK